MASIVIVGHGRSPEGKGWGERVDNCTRVMRMWDCQWQDPRDYGHRYDFGFLEAHPGLLETFYVHNRREPTRGWVASLLCNPGDCRLPEDTDLIDQTRWNRLGMAMGGVGLTGQLQFTRGTIAACWAIEGSRRGDQVILMGFDNIVAGRTLPLDQAFSPTYRANPGTISFAGYTEGATKFGNHDFAIEMRVLRHLAAKFFVTLSVADEVWA